MKIESKLLNPPFPYERGRNKHRHYATLIRKLINFRGFSWRFGNKFRGMNVEDFRKLFLGNDFEFSWDCKVKGIIQ